MTLFGGVQLPGGSHFGMAYAMMAFMAEPVGGRLSAALRETYTRAGVSQVQIADRLGVDQPTVSKWARGMRRPPLDVLVEVEALCDVPKGTILRRAGYVDDIDVSTVEKAIEADTALLDDDRRMILDAYRAARARATASRIGTGKVNEDDPDEVALWAIETLPESERWKLIEHIREVKRGDEGGTARRAG